jgi:CheY-like chemotaxis protein
MAKKILIVDDDEVIQQTLFDVLKKRGYDIFLAGSGKESLEMIPNDRDDDHMLALYKRDGHWGAVAKSNFVGLRFREPVYRTLRELVMSYFEQFL